MSSSCIPCSLLSLYQRYSLLNTQTHIQSKFQLFFFKTTSPIRQTLDHFSCNKSVSVMVRKVPSLVTRKQQRIFRKQFYMEIYSIEITYFHIFLISKIQVHVDRSIHEFYNYRTNKFLKCTNTLTLQTSFAFTNLASTSYNQY